MSDLLPFPLAGERVRLEATDAGAAIVRRADGSVVGSVCMSAAGGTLVIESLCVEAAHRGYGCGSETAGLIVDAAGADFRAVRAWAPPELGLATYFWSRMGLRPLHGAGPSGGIWFERALW